MLDPPFCAVVVIRSAGNKQTSIVFLVEHCNNFTEEVVRVIIIIAYDAFVTNSDLPLTFILQ